MRMNNKFFLTISVIAVYVTLFGLYWNFFKSSFECRYGNPCVRFCSTDTVKYPDAELIKSYKKFIPRYSSLDEKNVKIYRGKPVCGEMKHILRKEIVSEDYSSFDYYSEYNYHFNGYGKVYVSGEYYDHTRYCLEKSNEGEIELMVCHKDVNVHKVFHALSIIISILLLLFPTIVYIYFTELRDFYGKTLVLFMTSQICVYALIPFVKIFSSKYHANYEIIIAVVFNFMLTIIWITVMTVSLYMTFKNFRNSDYRKFEFSTYAKFGALFASYTLFLLIFDYMFSDRAILYLIMTYIFVVLCDVVLLIITGVYIFKLSQIREETEQAQFDNEKKWFWICLKLFGIMFVTWPFEIFSWSPDFNYFGLMTADFIKLFTAIVIVAMLIGREKVKILLFQKYRGIVDTSNA